MRWIFLLLIMAAGSFANAQSQQFKVGDKAPAFNAVAHDGSSVAIPRQGMTVLLFYRGYWCPFCNRQLTSLNDSLQFITNKGAAVIAVTPEKYESVEKTIAKTSAAFKIVSDTANVILKQFGVDYKVDDNIVQRYRKFGVDFTAVNGNNENTLPVPAVYIIDANGTIVYTWFDTDYRKRPSVKEILDHL